MRDVLVLFLMLLSIPFTLKRPVVGVLTYAVFSLMNPHRITYGFAGSFPFVMIIAVVTLFATLISKEKKQVPFTPLVTQLLIVIFWVTLTAVFALNQAGAWDEWTTVMKTMLIVVLTIAVTRTVNDVKALVLTVAASLGFWGLKGGLWTIATGGSNGLLGPPGTYIGDNNTLALAMVTSVPIITAVASFAPTKWTKRAAIAVAVLTGVSAVGSYSRGALLGGAAMVLFLWLKSTSKVKTGLLFALAIPLLLAAMPSAWMDRMHSINDYKEDASALGRINSWGFAINVANHLPLGGGFATFTPQIFQLYAPDPTVFFVAHSIYFQVLGEHGYIGLILYLLMFFFAWRTGSRIVKKCGKDPELAWAATTARMCQVSIIGYMTAGAFLAMAYYDLPYYVLAILVCLEKVLFIAPQPDNTPPLRLAFLSRRKAKAGAWKQPAPAPAPRKR
jgi:probable O-glycosylation ligase (exosortase A-associated)